MEWLNPKGIRELSLIGSIKRNYDTIIGMLKKRQTVSVEFYYNKLNDTLVLMLLTFQEYTSSMVRDAEGRRPTRGKSTAADESYLGYVNRMAKKE